MLFQLLRSVKKWVFSIFLDNKIADNEMRVIYGWEPDERKEK